ncbi:MAG: hypothetical protein J6T27_00030 [Alphaproteobacteria bacterium]|nr:hypothetical protein [Alphaproteobacteria bacterium]
MPGEKMMFQNLRQMEYDIAGNVLRAWYDDEGRLALVVDETIDEYKPNVLLVVRSDGTRRWDDLLQNVYNIDLELIRPKRDNKYQKLDIEYGGIDIYEDLIDAYENHGDLNTALADLIDFRDAAVRRAATVRLTNAQDEIAQAKATLAKTQKAIKSLNDRMRNFRNRLARQKSYVGREPTKQLASKILRTEAHIESTDEKLLRAEKRVENAKRRIDIATEEIDAATALLALRRPSVDSIDEMVKPRVIDAKAKKSDVARMPVSDIDVETEEEIEEPQDLEMSNDSKEVKPLLDKDPEILDDEIAFKPVDFEDMKPAARQTGLKRPLSPYAAMQDEPKPETVHDDGDRNDAAFGFPGEDDDENDDSLPRTDISDDYEEKTTKYEESREVHEEPKGEQQIKDENVYSSKSVIKEDAEQNDEEVEDVEEVKSEFEDNFKHDDFGSYSHDEPEYTEKSFDETEARQEKEPVVDTIKTVDESVPSDVDTTGQASTAQYDNRGIDAPSRPFSTVAVPKIPREEARPMSPIRHDEKPRPVGEKRSGVAYYILLILLIALSIFTLWLYQKKNGGTVPFPWMGQNGETTEPAPEPDVPVVLPDERVYVEPGPFNPEPEPVNEPVPFVEPTPVDKPIEVRYPNDDILRGGEPDVRVIESEEDVLARKAPYGVSRDDKPILVEVSEPVVEPVIQVTTVTAPDVIVEENVVSVPMPVMGEDVETVVEYDNPANVEFVEESYVVPAPQYVPEPEYVPASEPQYVQENYDYVAEESGPVEETHRDFSVHDGGQYSVTKTVRFIAD